ncbi:TonB-dependent receptor [Novosphingobium sp.]|uniref:TonB-dependent receptor n=1 Tax=Novosphingobium sp. TaxID=1874826 RepID=UPI0035B34DCD
MQTTNSRIVARMLCGVAAAAIAFAASPAFAQNADENSDDGVITVIGITKQAANVQDTPSAITAFSGDQLEQQGVRDVKEVAKFTPGFTIRDAGNNPTAFSLAIRGQIQNDNIATLDPSVGVYLDDVYIARAYGLNANLLDVESAQVLKGPQGTLFGRNTSAGAVLLKTVDPKFGDNSGQVQLTYGRFNEHSMTGIINVGGDKVALRGALFYTRRDGYQTDVHTGLKWGKTRTVNGRVKLAVKPVDNVTVLLSGEIWDAAIDGRVNQNQYFNLGGTGFDPAAADRALFGGDPDKVAVTDPAAIPGTALRGPNTNVKTQTYIGKVTIDTGFGEVKWINAYRKVKGNSLIDLDGASSVAFYHYTEALNDLKQYSSELQVTGKAMNDKLSFAMGVTYLKETGYDTSHSNAPNPPPGPSAIWTQFRGDIDNKSVGIYGQASYAVTDKLNITAGLRWSHDIKGVTVQSAVIPLNNPAAAVACLPLAMTGDNNGDGKFSISDCNRSREDTWSNLSYTVGFDYKVTEDVMLYAKQSRGYRAGAQQLRSLTLTDTNPAQPEIVNEQEVGLKTEFLDKRVRFNISGYHTTVKNAQRSVILNVGGTSRTVLENADTENWGFEADANIRVADGLNLFAGYAHTKPKYTKYNGFVVAGGVLTSFDKSGQKFGSIVNDQFSVGMNYNRDLGFARFGFNASYAWQGDMYQVGDPVSVLTLSSALGGGGLPNATEANKLIEAGKTPAYGITNMRASLAFGPDDNYEIAIWGRNVFDVRAKQYILWLGGFNYVGANWNDPATYGVSLTAKF